MRGSRCSCSIAGFWLTSSAKPVAVIDDLLATHYSPDWDQESDDVIWLRDHVPAINKRVMHLTAYRHRQRDHVDAPNIEDLVLRLTRVFAVFTDGLPPERRLWFPIQFE